MRRCNRLNPRVAAFTATRCQPLTIQLGHPHEAAEPYLYQRETLGADPLHSYRLHPNYSIQAPAHATQRLQNAGAKIDYEHPQLVALLQLTHKAIGQAHAVSQKYSYSHGLNRTRPHPAYNGDQLFAGNTQPTPALSTLSQHLASSAARIAGQLGTVGNCALGPRLAFDKFGYHLPQVNATEQGRIIEQSGLFSEVARSQVRPGDYAYRHWSNRVIRQHGGIDKGDAFIVAQIGRRGELYGANDHNFVVPEDGNRYTDTKYFRPNEEFLKRAKPS
jgi:hypothetical protein